MGMGVSYGKAPLVELIVEIRWPVKVIGMSGGPPIVGDSSASFDLWFQQMASSLRSSGFLELERLIPNEAPPIAQQPIFRFRMPGKPFPIYQFGHGVFTINAGPPDYKSWELFRPIVETGVKALIESMPQEGKPTAFSLASVRYIDAFGNDLREGRSNYAFMRDVLGVSINIPDELLSSAKDLNDISPTFAMKMPLSEPEEAALTFQLAAGRIGKEPNTDTIMDITYAVSKSLDIDVDPLLLVLDGGQEILHSWFITLTENIHQKMEPKNNY